MKPGLHRGVPMAEYRSWAAYGSTDMRAFRQGPPALVPWRRANPSEETEATRLGTAAHCAILEPLTFEARFAHKPDGMKFSTKEGIAWRDDPCRAGMTILTHDEWEQVGAIVHAFRSKSLAQTALAEASEIESSIWWHDPDTTLPLKARPDFYTEGGWTTDLKITRHANAGSIEFRAYVEGWMAQGAHYWAGLNEIGIKVKGARLVLVNPEPPQQHRVYCVEIADSALSVLHLENEKLIKEMAACHESGVWPGAPEEWIAAGLPPMALTQMDRAWDDVDESLTPLTKREWK